MLRIPIDPYRSRRPDGRTLDVSVDLDEEGGIVFAVDVDPRELIGTIRRNTDADAALDLIVGKYPDDLAVTTGSTEADALALADEVRRLRKAIEAVVDEVDLHPEPGEARAIAAALVHHADEVERVFGRRF